MRGGGFGPGQMSASAGYYPHRPASALPPGAGPPRRYLRDPPASFGQQPPPKPLRSPYGPPTATNGGPPEVHRRTCELTSVGLYEYSSNIIFRLFFIAYLAHLFSAVLMNDQMEKYRMKS